MVGAVMVVAALGASGLVYRATGQAPSSAEKRSDRKPVSELERLRHENELLKVNLEVVLEKVRAQDAELRTLRERIQGFNAKSRNEEIRSLNELYQETRIREVQKTLEEYLRAIGKKSGQPSQPADPRSSRPDSTPAEAVKRSDLVNQFDSTRSDRLMREERAIWSQRMSQPGRQYVTKGQAEADKARLRDAIIEEAIAALKLLREAPDVESQRKATDALDNALKKLREPKKEPNGKESP
jgi:hypothetical protein